MDKITQLWIRACKSRDPTRRIQSVYRRFYLKRPDAEEYVMRLLEDIVEKYRLMTLPQLRTVMLRSDMFPSCPETPLKKILDAYVSAIRLSHRDDLPGLTPPCMYRQKGELT